MVKSQSCNFLNVSLPWLFFLVSAILLGPALDGAVWSAEASPEDLKAGAAVRLVNPTKPAATIGHRVMRLFTYRYNDLRVQAFALEDRGRKRAVWLAVDFCVIHRSVVDRIKREIQKQHGVEPGAVCVNASHTHSAPPLSTFEPAVPEHFDPEYADFVVRQSVAVVGDALARLAPARLQYSEDTCRIATNRRTVYAPGRVRDHCPNPKGITDPGVQILAARSAADGRLLAVVVKYAGHPVNVVDIGLGADYPGFMRQAIEERHPGSVAVFLQGCGGDLVARRPNADMTAYAKASVEMAEALGRELAGAVERGLAKDGTPVTGPIRSEYAEISLPVDKVSAEEYKQAAARNDHFTDVWGKTYSEKLARGEKLPETWPYRIQTFRFGKGDSPLVVVALDGEVFCEYGLNLNRMLRPARSIVLGYSNGSVSYLPTAQAIRDGGYEPNTFRWYGLPGPYKPEDESLVLDAAARLARPRGRVTP